MGLRDRLSQRKVRKFKSLAKQNKAQVERLQSELLAGKEAAEAALKVERLKLELQDVRKAAPKSKAGEAAGQLLKALRSPRTRKAAGVLKRSGASFMRGIARAGDNWTKMNGKKRTPKRKTKPKTRTKSKRLSH